MRVMAASSRSTTTPTTVKMTGASGPAARPQLIGPSRPDFLRDELLHEMFQASASRFSGRPALQCRGQALSYGELQRRASRFARYLRGLGVGRGGRVAVWLPPGFDVHVSILGILEAGGAFVPIDPQWPWERAAHIVRDCGAVCLVAGEGMVPSPGQLPCRVVIPEREVAAIGAESARPILRAETGVEPADCAYLIYTSGSTGLPKGVMISHRSICHFVRAEGSVLRLRRSDRVFQGSPAAFDMSLEEVWPALVCGAQLLLGTGDRLHSGSDLAPWLARERVTVWTCVPTLLGMQTSAIPSLRLLNLGGEACPAELVRRWARPGLRIINTYGPTEATITATFAELAPDRPVTIGRPLSNTTVWVLDGELRPVGQGESGEICIGGPGLALGYAGRPDLTAERFVLNPAAGPGNWDPILYRTGDMARCNASGELEFLGRLDTQVKIRGFRVELSEIESVLLSAGGLRQAAVIVRRDARGAEKLVAYVVPLNGTRFDEPALRARLRKLLPPHMVPAIFEPLAELPVQSSGKVDRAALPAPTRAAAAERAVTPPATDAERKLHAAWSAIFAPAAVGIDDDFFVDLGGDSLSAAELVSALRRDACFSHVSMVDLYVQPTVRRLAARLEGTRPGPAATAATAPNAASSRLTHLLCGAGQAAGLLVVYGLFSLQWLIPYLSYAWFISQEIGRLASLAMSLGLFIGAIPVMLVIGIAAKWLILGRLRPGDYPLWGFTFYRWWLTQRLIETVPIHYLGGSPLLTFYYRLLGARIGPGVFLDSGAIDAPDCVAIGADTEFATEASLSCCKVEGERFRVGRIRVGRSCHVGANSILGMNTAMEDRAELGDLSMLPPGGVIPAGERWAGSPARFHSAADDGATARRSAPGRWAFAAGSAILLLIFPIFAVLPVFPGMMLMAEIDQNTDAYSFLLLSPVLAAVFVISMCLQIALLKWLLVGRVRAGRISVGSLAYVRHWLVGQLMALSLDIVNPLYATLYLNPWYRMLGVRVGPRAEISTASSISHDLLEVGEESFIADAVSLGAPRLHRGFLSLKRTVTGRRTFVGNSAVIPPGTELGDGVLIGVLSVPPADRAAALNPGSSWFGTPAVFLPRRQVTTRFGEDSTFQPRRGLILQRLAIEFVRVILPLTVVIALTSVMMSIVGTLDDDDWGPGDIAPLFPLFYLGLALAAGAFTVLVKWLVIGRYKVAEKPLWSHFVWRSELVTSTYENLAVPFFADMLRGTPFLPAYLRLLGCRIGKRVYLDTTDITEFDMVRIGDGAALNCDCGPQTHLFEDRVMKIGPVDIGRRCVLGGGSIVLYGASMEEGSTLGELSLLMKGENLPASTRWEGSPARPAARPGPQRRGGPA